ncbi:hypothetical protein MZD04_gp230 [Pseudomonas phage Psa21]|uniref:Uncharacterized protein n=1 Tax=Pseudomonas phage Psa21 TaxID=2530023 RepID=A0A481W4P0_9CAUD|nr:hypothetical protein MZD04_gp230 [Pseudomonas phage Psa21]QBJ02756.1 hypothetical protein PSA21_230 [Pseudomonas phage Psa21]
MKLSTAITLIGVSALGYVAYRYLSDTSVTIEGELVQKEDQLLLPAPEQKGDAPQE